MPFRGICQRTSSFPAVNANTCKASRISRKTLCPSKRTRKSDPDSPALLFAPGSNVSSRGCWHIFQLNQFIALCINEMSERTVPRGSARSNNIYNLHPREKKNFIPFLLPSFIKLVTLNSNSPDDWIRSQYVSRYISLNPSHVHASQTLVISATNSSFQKTSLIPIIFNRKVSRRSLETNIKRKNGKPHQANIIYQQWILDSRTLYTGNSRSLLYTSCIVDLVVFGN